ncbi:hypothetical protein BsWGS_18496 [Bradybaena similaris]
MSMYGYSGSNYDRFVENANTSTLHKMKETYWTTKQAVFKKLGKKEDEHVVASDSQLDAKLEVFKAIQRSSMELLRVIERYQDRLCVVSQEENTMGRLLKAHSNKDKTRAGKMMAAVGKAESNSAQERLALHNPLRRLYQEVETFRYRAVSDTLVTINRMESARTEYRGALLWMKNVSEELDPDMYKQLEKFRKVQSQVRKTKSRFDKLKLDVMQKVDLLAASRCNMFSHVLANYQTMLLHYWEKTSRTMSAVAESFKGYQYYEFNMLRELTETSKKLALETSNQDATEKEGDEQDDNLISVEEGEQGRDARDSAAFDDKLLSDLHLDDKLLSDLQLDGKRKQNSKVAAGNKDSEFMDFTEDDNLLKDDDDDFDFTGKIMETAAKNKKMQKPEGTDRDLLTGNLEQAPDDDEDKDDMTLLNEILNAPSTGEDEFAQEWAAVFGGAQASLAGEGAQMENEGSQQFLPSNLLETQLAGMASGNNASLLTPSGSVGAGLSTFGQGVQSNAGAGNEAVSKKGQKSKPQPLSKGTPQSDMSAWFNLFADLDPLSNPDAIGRKPDDISDA